MTAIAILPECRICLLAQMLSDKLKSSCTIAFQVFLCVLQAAIPVIAIIIKAIILCRES